MKTPKYRLLLLLGMVMVFLAAGPGTVWAHPNPTTPCGGSVAHDHLAPDWTALQKAQIQTTLQIDFPLATVVEAATKNYNCHAYAWTGKDLWVNNPAVYIDSYEVDWAEGHKLTYLHCLTHNPTHSAIDTEPLDYKANSKWGALCLMYHDWNYVPDGRPMSPPWGGPGRFYSNYGSVVACYDRADCICGNHQDCEI
jgi:hypothetical protein